MSTQDPSGGMESLNQEQREIVLKLLRRALQEPFVEEARCTMETVAGCEIGTQSVEPIDLDWEQISRRLNYPTCLIDVKEDHDRVKGLGLLINFPGTYVFPAKMLLISPPVLEEMISEGEDTETLTDALLEIGNMLTGGLNHVVSSAENLLHFKQSDTLIFKTAEELLDKLKPNQSKMMRASSFAFVVEDYPPIELLLLCDQSNFAWEEVEDEEGSGEAELPLFDLAPPPAEPPPEPALPPLPEVAPQVAAPSRPRRTGGKVSLSKTRISEVMSQPLHSLDAEDKVGKGLETMAECGVSHLPLLKAGRLAGAVTRADLMSARSIFLTRKFDRHRSPRDDSTLGFPLRWFMRPPVTAAESLTIGRTLALLERSAGHAVIVVDDAERPVGIFTTTDLLQVLRGGR